MQSKERNSVQFHDDPEIKPEQPSTAPSSLGALRVVIRDVHTSVWSAPPGVWRVYFVCLELCLC